MMNLLIALVIIGLSVLARSPSSDAGGAEPTLVTAETMVGAWSGHWASENPAGRGSAELVLARVPGRDKVVGQFTFLTGGVARSLRYEGRIDDRSVRFPLVGDGRIVLEAEAAARPGTAQRLKGEWHDERGALPAPRGVIELSRVK